MPNWCENKLIVTGSKEYLNAFVKDCFTKQKDDFIFDFNKIMPPPSSPETCPKKYIDPKWNPSKPTIEKSDGQFTFLENPWFDWYSWRLDNWGTKWICDVSKITKSKSKDCC